MLSRKERREDFQVVIRKAHVNRNSQNFLHLGDWNQAASLGTVQQNFHPCLQIEIA